MNKDIEFAVRVIADTVLENEDCLTELGAVVGDIKSPTVCLSHIATIRISPDIYYRYISSSVSKIYIMNNKKIQKEPFVKISLY